MSPENNRIEFLAHKYSMKQDHEGEVKIVLTVPLLEAHKIFEVPIMKNLKVIIEPQG